MIKDYTTKDIKKSTTKTKTVLKDGDIFQDGKVWKFKWKGSECGYLSKQAAKDGLKKISGTSNKKD